MNEKRNKYIRYIGNILVCISIVFLIRKLMGLDIDYAVVMKKENALKMIPVVLIFSAHLLYQFIPWKLMIKTISGIDIPNTRVLSVFMRSAIMKYIPGNIFQFVGRGEIINYSKDLNVTIVAASVVIESITMLLAALIVGGIGAKEYLRSVVEGNILFGIMVGLLCVLVLISFFLRKKITHFMQEKGVRITSRFLVVFLFSVMLFSTSFVIQGFMLTYVMGVISAKSEIECLAGIVGAYSIGWLAGYITPGASGGIGIRETILCLLLEGIVASETVLLSVLVFRVINILADFLAFGISQGIMAITKDNRYIMGSDHDVD